MPPSERMYLLSHLKPSLRHPRLIKLKIGTTRRNPHAVQEKRTPRSTANRGNHPIRRVVLIILLPIHCTGDNNLGKIKKDPPLGRRNPRPLLPASHSHCSCGLCQN